MSNIPENLLISLDKKVSPDFDLHHYEKLIAHNPTISNMNFNIPDSPKFVTPEERNKHLTDRMDNTNKLLTEQNDKISELQRSLDKSNNINEYQKEQLKELNNKLSESKYLQKIAESNLQEEHQKSINTEKSNKILQIIICIIGITTTICGTYLGYWLNLPK